MRQLQPGRLSHLSRKKRTGPSRMMKPNARKISVQTGNSVPGCSTWNRPPRRFRPPGPLLYLGMTLGCSAWSPSPRSSKPFQSATAPGQLTRGAAGGIEGQVENASLALARLHDQRRCAGGEYGSDAGIRLPPGIILRGKRCCADRYSLPQVSRRRPLPGISDGGAAGRQQVGSGGESIRSVDDDRQQRRRQRTQGAHPVGSAGFDQRAALVDPRSQGCELRRVERMCIKFVQNQHIKAAKRLSRTWKSAGIKRDYVDRATRVGQRNSVERRKARGLRGLVGEHAN